MTRVIGLLRYWQKVQAMFGSSILAYWPLNERSGSVAYDIVNGRNGAYVNSPTLANALSRLGRPSPLFGVGSMNAWTAALAAAFNGFEGAIGGFIQVPASIWTDGAIRMLFNFMADGNNLVSLYKNTTNNWLTANYRAGGISIQPLVIMGNTNWFHFLLEWSFSKNYVGLRINGTMEAIVSGGLGTWSGAALASNTTRFGSYDGGSELLPCNMSDLVVLNTQPTDDQAMALASGGGKAMRLGVLGDSISVNSATKLVWPDVVRESSYKGMLGVLFDATGGYSIMNDLALEVSIASSFNAGVFIIELGTNDNNAGDMNALQNTILTQIPILQASNPKAEIYWLNVLPKWTDSTGTTPVDMSNVRTAIAAACSTLGITCWDTFTTPWITASDTDDGTHPNAGGHAKIGARVIARLP